MQRKLDFTRAVVAGLATEDFEKISKGAQDLMLLSHEADWKVITSPEYLKMSREFRETTERLREQGRQKNLDGATIAYFEVTLNCIRCHKQLRQQQK
jgi:cytochrome c556